VAVGAPLLDAAGRPIAAISLGGTRTRLTDERVPEIGHLVRTAAARISHQLGHRRNLSTDSTDFSDFSETKSVESV
jgi:IclR family acetate operon transcriptional repressor